MRRSDSSNAIELRAMLRADLALVSRSKKRFCIVEELRERDAHGAEDDHGDEHLDQREAAARAPSGSLVSMLCTAT